MNITLDLSKAQLSKLRNGHGIRISPAMFGSGTDLIIDPMTYHNMAKKLDKGKGAVITMGSNEIEMNKMEGTGLFAGMGNKSGKISRIKKAKKWRDFSVHTAKQGIDTAKYGFDKYQEAVNPLKSKFKKLFGGELESESEEEMEVEGGKISFKGIKKAYNKNVKNTKLGKALRDSAGMAIGDVYDKAGKELDKNKYGKPISQYMKDKKGSNVKRLTEMTGVGLKLSGDGKMKTADYRGVRPAVMPRGWNRKNKGSISELFEGNGMKLSGGRCCGCGMMNDKFLFQNQAL